MLEKEAYLKKLDQVREISTLPAILAKVNQVLTDDNASIAKLGKVIETDQAISTKILKLVNSAFYGFRAKISSIRHAIVIMGINSVRNAVVSISVFDAFSEKGGKVFDSRVLWTHSVSVAVVSKYLAMKTRLASPDDSFVAGLLHDIGKIIMAQNFRESFDAILGAMREKKMAFFDAEKETVPLNHAQIGGHFGKKWQFPQNLVEAIHSHHCPAQGKEDPGLPLIVHLANEIANQGAASLKIDSKLRQLSPEKMEVLTPCLETAESWFPQLSNEIELACQFFTKEERG